MNTMQKQTIFYGFSFGFLTTGLVILTLWLALTIWFGVDRDELVWGVQIASIPVGQLSSVDAHTKLDQELPPLDTFEYVLLNDDQRWATNSATLGEHRDLDEAITIAQQIGRQGPWQRQLADRFQLLWEPQNVEIPHHLNPDFVQLWVASVAAQLDEPGKPPSVEVSQQGYTLEPGEAGRVVDQAAVVSRMLHNPRQKQFTLDWQEVHHPLTEAQQASSEARLARLWGKRLKIEASELEPAITLTASDFFPWLQLPEGWQVEPIQTQLAEWDATYRREPQNAVLEITPDQQVKKFEPHREGRSIDRGQTQARLLQALNDLDNESTLSAQTVPLSFVTVEPETPLGKTNSLGIQELIGVGTSTYFGSIANRVYNIGLTSSRLHATLVPPGKEFSFNQSVGEISAQTGYKSAYVIRNGRTELGDGGGVCQVSTTVFRAALDAGLPITTWKAHSYRVGYYEQNNQPGFDATVYAPSTDFRFRNDTGHYLLVGSYADTANRFLRVEIWGTDDGRQSSISHYQLGNQRPAPAPLYQEDPSLPPGTTKQVDWAAAGATASFDYQVTSASGEAIFAKTFRSVYKPWQAVYLVGPTQ